MRWPCADEDCDFIMQIQQLQHFQAAVKFGNLSRAAEACSITQPAITRSIKRLEGTLGVQLLERSARGVSPTAAGEVLDEYARKLAQDMRLVRKRLTDISGRPVTEVCVGISSNLQHEGLAAALAAVLRAAPDCRFSIHQDSYLALFAKLTSGELDVVVTLLPPDIDEHAFSFVELQELPGALLVSATHHLAGRDKVRAAELTKYKWVVLGQHDHAYLARTFAGYGIEPPVITVTANSPLLMRDLLLAEPLIGFAPRHMFVAQMALGQITPINSELDPLSARRGIVRRKNDGRSPQLDLYIDKFQAAYQAVLPRTAAPA